MKHNLFSVYDNAAKAYLPIFQLPEIDQAKRVFSDAVNDKNHAFGAHPTDYTLFHIGVYDDESATFELPAAPISLGVGNEYIKSE